MPGEHRSPGGALVAAFCLLIAAAVVACAMQFSSPGFLHLGWFFPLLLLVGGTVLGLPVLAIVLALHDFLARRNLLPAWFGPRFLLVAAVALAALIVGAGWRDSRPQRRLESKLRLELPALRGVEASGFNSFRGSRWLFRFEAPPDEVDRIVRHLALESWDGKGLKEALGRWGNFDGLLEAMPESGAGVRCFSIDTPLDEESVTWWTMVVDDHKATVWLLWGFQG